MAIERLKRGIGMDELDDITIPFDEFLEHFGIKGMQWGVRKDRTPGVSGKTDREAKKDAEEFARAKLFFGDGAGTRRKLIKASVEAKTKKDPAYKQAFDAHLARQDMSTHAQKARGERQSIDRRDRTKKQAGAVARRITGEQGTQAAFVIATGLGAVYLSNPTNRANLAHKANSVRTFVQNRANMNAINAVLRRGMGG